VSLPSDCFTQSGRCGTNVIFTLLLLPSGIRIASLEALIAAYYSVAHTAQAQFCAVPDLHAWGLAGMLEDGGSLGTSPALVGVCVVRAPSMCCQ